MSWIDEQRERLAEQRTLGDRLKEASSWGFVALCVGVALAGAYAAVGGMDGAQRLQALITGSPGVTQVASAVGTAGEDRWSSIAGGLASSGGARIGQRSRATFLPACRHTFAPGEEFGGMNKRAGSALPSSPEEYELRFSRMETVNVGMVLAKLAVKAEKVDAMKVDAASVAVTAIFSGYVNCALAQPSAALCNPDNRAAALAMLQSYFANYPQAQVVVGALKPEERVELDRWMPPYRHGDIESNLEKHLRAGVLRADDLGYGAPDSLVARFDRHKSAKDSCAASAK